MPVAREITRGGQGGGGRQLWVGRARRRRRREREVRRVERGILGLLW